MVFPNESPKRIDSVAKSTTEDPMGRSGKKYSTGSKNPDESSAEILALLVTLSLNVKDVVGNVDSLRDEIKGNEKNLQNLEEEMSSKMEEGFKKARMTASPK